MAIDLILYAAIAAGLVMWLRNILGTRHGEERPRPPMMGPMAGAEVVEASLPAAVNDEKNDPIAQSINKLAEANDDAVFAIANDKARDGIHMIATGDKMFEITNFMHAAQDAFVMAVEAFAEGDTDTLADLLDKNVYTVFEDTIKTRNASEHIQRTQIHAVTQTHVIEAGINKNDAFVTIRFEADQTTYMTDKDGNALDTTAEETHKIIDIWTFGRTIKSADPRWMVIETRGDFEGDNDIIPDAS